MKTILPFYGTLLMLILCGCATGQFTASPALADINISQIKIDNETPYTLEIGQIGGTNHWVIQPQNKIAIEIPYAKMELHVQATKLQMKGVILHSDGHTMIAEGLRPHKIGEYTKIVQAGCILTVHRNDFY